MSHRHLSRTLLPRRRPSRAPILPLVFGLVSLYLRGLGVGSGGSRMLGVAATHDPGTAVEGLWGLQRPQALQPAPLHDYRLPTAVSVLPGVWVAGCLRLCPPLQCVGDSWRASHGHHSGGRDERQPRRHHNLQLGTGIWSWHPACPHPCGAR